MHCNLTPPEPRQFFLGLITTLCQVCCRWTHPLLFAADTLLYTVTLTYNIWPWTFAVYRLWRVETLYQIWTQSRYPRRCYCNFNIWPNDLEHVLRVALGSNNFHQVRPSTTYPCLNYPCLNYSVFWCWYVMSRCDLDLWPVALESSWYINRHVIKVRTRFERNRATPAKLLIDLRIYAHVMSRCDIDLWPLDLELLQQFWCHAFKICPKFERNRIIHCWVMDDLAYFRCAILGVGHVWTDGSQECVNGTSPNLSRT